MPLKMLNFKPGVNREVSRYAAETGWYDCDKVRFRQGLPEKIGGWRSINQDTFQGVCRALTVWNTDSGSNFVGLGTHLKYYLYFGGLFFDITPLRLTTSAGDVTFSATDGSTTITVSHTSHEANEGDFVTFSGAVSLGGNIAATTLNKEFQIASVIDANTYTVEVTIPAIGSDTGNGGAAVVGEYQISIGPEYAVSVSGWGAGGWSTGSWSNSESSPEGIRIWNHSNFGRDLVYGATGGQLYYWDSTSGTTSRGVEVSTLPGASDVPLVHNALLVSDVYRFVFVFGTNALGSSQIDAMLIRWSDQEDVANWTPSATNQAGDLRLSRGSQIITAVQARQEILVFTDAALYSLQYLGAPAVWGATLLGVNTSLTSKNAVASANGMTFWMGKDSFYKYDGRLQPLRSDVLSYVFGDINREQYSQCFASTVEAFNEVWFFYCSANSNTIDRYVIYDYVENDWSIGTMARTAWVDSAITDYPLAATYNGNLVEHENGADDNETSTPAPIHAYVQTGDFDLEDGDRVMFVWRCLPDFAFFGSTVDNPQVNMTFIPRYTAGDAPINPESVGGTGSGDIVRNSTYPVTQFTGQINTRVRGRHLSLRVESNTLGVQWKMGMPRIDVRPDGRR